MTTIRNYTQALEQSLKQSKPVLISKLKEISGFKFFKDIDLLEFNFQVYATDFQLMLYSMDKEANEVFYEGNDKNIFSGSDTVLEETEYLFLTDEELDTFDDSLFEHDEELAKIQEETVVTWFMSCWNEAIGTKFPLPVYVGITDAESCYDIQNNKWISDEDKWA
ncbi:hypothetical protein U8V72_19975 [Priestia filamentosa]|uniref:hypothetical protein n=1 Tax=Priestia filamentosa TaxID=1402861 RepID=UPI003979DE4E